VVSPTSPAKAPMFAIVIHEKGGAERRELFEGAELSVGRVQGNDLMLPKGNVSKRHARLLYRDGRFIVTDLNSTNGTYVNRRRITQATIVREGDRIYIGDFILRIEPSPGVAESSVAMPMPMPMPSVPPAARQALPTSGDSQPGATGRPSADEEDELTRAPIRSPLLRSSPVAAPEPAFSSLTGRSADEEESTQRLLVEAVSVLVERVARALHPAELEAEVSPDLSGRIDQSIREAWATLVGDRAVPTNLPIDRVMALARGDLVELGPLAELLADSSVTEIAVLGHDRITVMRGGRATLLDTGFSCTLAVRWAVARLCARSGVPLGDSAQIERQLPDGATLTASLAPGSPPIVLINRPQRVLGSLDDLVRRGTASRTLVNFLQQCLLARLNLLVIGPRDGGAELVLSALVSSLGERDVVYSGRLLGDAAPSANEASLGGSMRALSLAARAPYVRLFADLSTGPVTSAVIAAAAEGSEGIVAARTASSLRRGLLRLASDLRPRYGTGAMEMLAGAFEIVIEVARLRDDRHRILRVAEVLGVSGDDLELSDVFSFAIDRTASGGLIEGSFTPSSTMPAIADLMRTRGAPIDSALFMRPSSR
jgi:pilus assembly protein CpaF